jgi:hypothetical protein
VAQIRTASAGARPAGGRPVGARVIGALAGATLVGGVVALPFHGPGGPVGLVVLRAYAATLLRPGARHAAAARPGERIPPGTLVTTAAGGDAVLSVNGPRMYLGPATVATISGHPALRRGHVLVDARSQPALTVTAGAVSVLTAGGSATELQTGYALRVGTLTGSAQVTSSTGRSLRLPALHQLLASGAALPAVAPGGLPPLQLSDDAAERAVVPRLVTDDELLQAQAAAIDQTASGAALRTEAMTYLGGAVSRAGSRTSSARADLAAFSGPVVLQPAGPPSATVLPFALAMSTGRAVFDRYRAALRWRAAGGSWGVVAALLGTTGLRSARVLQQLLAGLGAGGGRPASAPVAGSHRRRASARLPGSAAGRGSRGHRTVPAGRTGGRGSGGSGGSVPATPPPHHHGSAGGSGGHGGTGRGLAHKLTKTVRRLLHKLQHTGLPGPLPSKLPLP